MNSLTVIIPTYNRCATLQKVIQAYLDQTESRAIAEILVVDDGSTDPTPALVARLSRESPIRIRYFRQENRGPAAARNVGIREAKTDLILFTDDDIIPSTSLVAEHLAWHRRFPEPSAVVLGKVTWSPEVNPTPFMNWYGTEGPLFAYARLEDRIEIEYRYFYTCNLCLKTQFLRKNGTFDEDFKVAAYEDIELGFRLNKAGMRLRYNRNALAYHHQYVSFADACRRSKKAASAAEVLKRKEAGGQYPAPLGQSFVRQIVKWAAPILSPFRSLMDARVPLPSAIYRIMFVTFR
jgi:glycosyltransferase involved in cell wall biosynthesis